jgi:hypothetical protein
LLFEFARELDEGILTRRVLLEGPSHEWRSGWIDIDDC